MRWRAAAQSGAALVVCRGEAMAKALFNIQGEYPNVHYLLFDDEPHSEDYTAYTTEASVHCVLFREEQAGYLAGYAAVAEGYTTLGFVGSDELPRHRAVLHRLSAGGQRRGPSAMART